MCFCVYDCFVVMYACVDICVRVCVHVLEFFILVWHCMCFASIVGVIKYLLLVRQPRRVGTIYIGRYISMIFSNLYRIYIVGKNQEKIMIFSKIYVNSRYYPRKEKVIKKLQNYINYIIIVIWKLKKKTNKSLFLTLINKKAV